MIRNKNKGTARETDRKRYLIYPITANGVQERGYLLANFQRLLKARLESASTRGASEGFMDGSLPPARAQATAVSGTKKKLITERVVQ